MKTGGWGGPWIELERPKPPPVRNHYDFWGDPPDERSARCAWWVRQIDRGWRPNRAIESHCYDCSAQWYGIWIWEYVNVIAPKLDELRGDR